MKITLTKTYEVEPKYLHASCEVRYWEDSKINGVEDTDGSLVPCREGDDWCPKIDLETGIITNWKQGVSAFIHYKICDAGTYTLYDKDMVHLRQIDGYVPPIMYPRENGFGDYVMMNINEDGLIEDFKINFEDFEDEDDD